MRAVGHVVAIALVLTVAAVCTLVQIDEVDHAIDRLGTDRQSVIQVGKVSDGPRRHRGSEVRP